jgi:uncharacterized Zn finger protein
MFERNGSNLNAYCTCPAGDSGVACKHRLNILYGVIDGIVSGNSQDVATVSGWIAGTDVENALRELEDAERLMKSAQDRVKAAKKQLTVSLRR